MIIHSAENISIGDYVSIDEYCVLEAGKAAVKNKRGSTSLNDSHVPEGELIIGNNIHIVSFCLIIATGGVEISDNCVLGAGVKIYSISILAYDPYDRGKRITILPYEQTPHLYGPSNSEAECLVGIA